MATATKSKGKRAKSVAIRTNRASASAAKAPIKAKLPAAPKKAATLHQKFVHLEGITKKTVGHVKKLEKDGYLPKGSATTMTERLSGNLDTMIAGVRKRYVALPGRTTSYRKKGRKS